MNAKPTLKIERKPIVLDRTGWSRSTLHSRIKEGLFTPPILLGARAVGWPDYETTAILLALMAGKSKAETQEIVKDLIEQRKGSMGVAA
ncbi:MAG: AlpA family phage regulatory protein [Gammaproteobacteria bacterium]|nr:AlpA family phage regulatory protein [Gammaproteobacteria bacterium]